jgi:hypothetical protein
LLSAALSCKKLGNGVASASAFPNVVRERGKEKWSSGRQIELAIGIFYVPIHQIPRIALLDLVKRGVDNIYRFSAMMSKLAGGGVKDRVPGLSQIALTQRDVGFIVGFDQQIVSMQHRRPHWIIVTVNRRDGAKKQDGDRRNQRSNGRKMGHDRMVA